jgi:serine/threonine protein kinase
LWLSSLGSARDETPSQVTPPTRVATLVGAGERVAPDAGGYERLEWLGEGGMGVVYRAHDPALNRTVALKMIREGALGPEGRARFRTEAEALARLSHPHVVAVFAWYEHDGRPCLVMEYVAGGTLEDRLARSSLSVVESARLVVVLARAVQAAHAAGVVHRDLKPGNVLMAPPVEGNSGTVAGGFPKVSDFGLARLAGAGAHTSEGRPIGTPAYMAPSRPWAARRSGQRPTSGRSA